MEGNSHERVAGDIIGPLPESSYKKDNVLRRRLFFNKGLFASKGQLFGVRSDPLKGRVSC